MKTIRKEIANLIHEAMNQHELARDFYHRLAHRVSHADSREMLEYLAQEAEENKGRLQSRYDAVEHQHGSSQYPQPDALSFPQPKPDKVTATDFA